MIRPIVLGILGGGIGAALVLIATHIHLRHRNMKRTKALQAAVRGSFDELARALGGISAQECSCPNCTKRRAEAARRN